MNFIPSTDIERKKMLDTIGIDSIDDLLQNIPPQVKLTQPLNLPPALSEFEAMKLLREYSKKNMTADTHVCFMGGGAYDHFIPSIVGAVLNKPEFKTAYTPYQAEVSQGTLQAMYEFQSMIAELTSMDVSNASLYDAGSGLAEACFMANAHNRKSEFLYAGTVNPNYVTVTNTITAGRNYTFKHFVKEDGTADLEGLAAAMNENTAGVIVQMPNFLGNLEDVFEIEKIAHSKKALFIVVVNPMSLGIIEAPGSYNADVVVGEGQPFGIPMNFGGPYLGLFACKNEFVRKIPGRLAGVTEDLDGKRCFVLTLQTREQQIKREKATSNICTNQGLFMLAATVYMETMGKQGIKEVSEQCFRKAHYVAEEISKIKGFELINDKPFYNEFAVTTPVPSGEITKKALDEGFIAGLDVTAQNNGKPTLLIAVTEKRTKEQMDDFINFLKKFAK
ncbi:MAG: aminomethyl-transferring glycine dehydrogenase subunit GcvPA [Candidatus Kapabacteria bacterium]|nr:aminomethyl-transferring glycine dehydrogenase subunit GcvPA [Ignavibacteriota bacterium]MCW5883894.1 aminomethyl-transferring glycine dehydrogenase subunit GcvPA [Candidatus Kapabacteria bacterium]